MTQHPITFFSPSYRGDLERFLLLRRSIRCFAPTTVRHLVAVPSEDAARFKRAVADQPEVELVLQQDLVPRYFYPRRWYPLLKVALPAQAWRFAAHAGRPGWITQQIVKLSIPQLVSAGPVAILDSDVLFLRPFSLKELGASNPTRSLMRAEPTDEASRHREHMHRARELLGLPEGPSDHHYMACPAIWYPEWVLALQRQLELVSGTDWRRALFDARTFSEYLLYGVFVEEILKPADLRVRLERFHAGVWSVEDFRDLLARRPSPSGLGSGPLTLVVQSNLGIPTTEYLRIAEEYFADGRAIRAEPKPY